MNYQTTIHGLNDLDNMSIIESIIDNAIITTLKHGKTAEGHPTTATATADGHAYSMYILAPNDTARTPDRKLKLILSWQTHLPYR